MVFAACVLAMTVTPLGLSFWTEIPQSLSRISQYTFDEWKRPGLTEFPLLPFWIIGLIYCAAILLNVARLRRMTPGEVTVHACTLALLPGAIGAVRNVGPFLMLAVPALTSLVYARNERQVPDVGTEIQRPLVNLALMCIGALAVALTLTSAYRNSWPRLRWTPVPSGALAALQQCPDNLYNRYDEGGFLLWFAPDRKVFLDGRQDPYPMKLVLEHIMIENDRADPWEMFARHGIRCAYLPTGSPVARRLPEAGWKALYQDPKWVVLRD
jgi:hypothetical protein